MKNGLKKLSVIVAAAVLAATSLAIASCGKKVDPVKEPDILVKKETTIYADSTFRMEYTYKYDEDGKLIEKVEESEESSDRETVKSIYTYVGDLLATKENFHLKEDGSWDPSFVHTNGYDANGNLVLTMGYSVEDGVKELFAVDIFEYNDKGLEVKYSSYIVDEGDLNVSIVVEMEYDDKGQEIKEKYYEYDFLTEEVVFSSYYVITYNADGTEKEMKCYTAEDELLTVARFTYDDKGNLTLSQTYELLEDGTERIFVETVSEYDSDNRLVKDSTYYFNEETEKKELQYYTTYEY